MKKETPTTLWDRLYNIGRTTNKRATALWRGFYYPHSKGLAFVAGMSLGLLGIGATIGLVLTTPLTLPISLMTMIVSCAAVPLGGGFLVGALSWLRGAADEFSYMTYAENNKDVPARDTITYTRDGVEKHQKRLLKKAEEEASNKISWKVDADAFFPNVAREADATIEKVIEALNKSHEVVSDTVIKRKNDSVQVDLVPTR